MPSRSDAVRCHEASRRLTQHSSLTMAALRAGAPVLDGCVRVAGAAADSYHAAALPSRHEVRIVVHDVRAIGAGSMRPLSARHKRTDRAGLRYDLYPGLEPKNREEMTKSDLRETS